MNYNVKFINETPKSLSIGISQKLPNKPSLTNIVWDNFKIASGKSSTVSWKDNYGVSLCDYILIGGKRVYTPKVYYDAEMGDRWEVYFDNYQQLRKIDNDGSKDQISVVNSLYFNANIGLGINGGIALVENDVFYNCCSVFAMPIECYIGVYDDLMFKEVVDDVFCFAFKKIVFKNGLNNAKITAKIVRSNIKFDVEYSKSESNKLSVHPV